MLNPATKARSKSARAQIQAEKAAADAAYHAKISAIVRRKQAFHKKIGFTPFIQPKQNANFVRLMECQPALYLYGYILSNAKITAREIDLDYGK
jgi:hypothetical protein